MNSSNEAFNVVTSFENNNYALSSIVPHCAVMLVLDTSHSMWGQGLSDMKRALAAFYDKLAYNQFNGAAVDIAAVSLGDNLKMLEDFTLFAESALPTMAIRPKGDTPIGAALTLALEKIHEQIAKYRQHGQRYVVPQMIVLTDGRSSSDDYTQIASLIRRECAEGKLYCRAIAMGKEPDFSTLQAFAGNDVMTPVFGRLDESFAVTAREVASRYKGETLRQLKKSEHNSKSKSSRLGDSAVAQQPTSSTTSGRAYLLDGSNIIHWDKEENGPRLDIVLAITDEFDRQNIPYRVIFDATARHILRKQKPHDSSKLESLFAKRPAQFKQAPAGIQADVFLLSEASRNPDAIIITNDQYRDHFVNYPWLKQEDSRLLKGMVIDDTIFVLTDNGKNNMQFSMSVAEKMTL